MLEYGAGSASNAPSYVKNLIKQNMNWFNKYEKEICRFLKN